MFDYSCRLHRLSFDSNYFFISCDNPSASLRLMLYESSKTFKTTISKPYGGPRSIANAVSRFSPYKNGLTMLSDADVKTVTADSLQKGMAFGVPFSLTHVCSESFRPATHIPPAVVRDSTRVVIPFRPAVGKSKQASIARSLALSPTRFRGRDIPRIRTASPRRDEATPERPLASAALHSSTHCNKRPSARERNIHKLRSERVLCVC